MTEGVLRRLATLTSVKRTRAYDEARRERNGDPGREERIEAALFRIEDAADELKEELGLR